MDDCDMKVTEHDQLNRTFGHGCFFGHSVCSDIVDGIASSTGILVLTTAKAIIVGESEASNNPFSSTKVFCLGGIFEEKTNKNSHYPLPIPRKWRQSLWNAATSDLHYMKLINYNVTSRVSDKFLC